MLHRSTIHQKFIAVVIAVVVPFLLTSFYWAYENAQESEQAAQSNAQLLARLIAVSLERNLSTAQHSVPTTAFYAALDELDRPDGSTMTLVDRRGQIMARYPTRVGDVDSGFNNLGVIRQIQEFSDPSVLRQQAAGEEQLWGVAQSSDGQWRVIIQIPTAVAYADAWNDMRRNLLFTGLITLFVLGLARFLSHRITRPIQRLTEHIQAVKTGDLPAPMRMQTRDETQLLAESFNIMATNLRERDAERAQLFAQLERHQSELEYLSAQLLRLQEEERRRVARELHDEIGQSLGAITLNLQVAERMIHQDPHRALEHIADTKTLARQARQEINRIAHDLRPSVLDDFGLAPALRWYTTDFARRTGIAVELEAEDLQDRLSPEIEVALYRTVQEALTNSFKHAGAGQVRVLLTRRPSALILEVTDDGQGFDPEQIDHDQRPDGGLGILGLRERAACLGATFHIDSRPGCGVTVRLEVPVS